MSIAAGRIFSPVQQYAELGWGLLAASRYPYHEDAAAPLRDQLKNREARFLETLRRVVFAHQSHPLRRMLTEAQCEYGDIEASVARDGLETTLSLLRACGVYLSSDEFKGRQPIVRNGRHIPASPSSFINPLCTAAWQNKTSGTTGTTTSIPASLAQLAHSNYYRVLALRQLGVAERRWLAMAAILPSTSGILRNVWNKKSGFQIHRWYTAPGNRSKSRLQRAVTRALLLELRLLGVPAPGLRFLPQNDFLPVAREIAAARIEGIQSFVSGSPSSCVRVAAAALETGLDISGARFWTGGEGLSAAKAATFHQAGAESYASYMTTEFGAIGFACPHYEGRNTVHHFRDATAIVSAPRSVPGGDADIPSLFFTNLLPLSSLFVINLELGDQGIVGHARCNCCFSKLGFTTVISNIQSYTKLTGHGITQTGADVTRVIEEALPARFGGSPSDYQLAEQEINGQTVMILRVNPRVGRIPAVEVEGFFLGEVGKLFGGSLTVRTWTHAGAFRVVAESPLAGSTGKVLPLHLLGRLPITAEKETAHAT